MKHLAPTLLAIFLLSVITVIGNPDPIDIGAPAVDRQYSFSPKYTILSVENPANGDGTITQVEIYANVDMTGAKVGTFYGSAPDFTSRDNETIGNVASGAKQTFTGLNIDVKTGDLIGIYYSSGNIDANMSGSGLYYYSGDAFGAGSLTYTLYANWDISINGTGETDTCTPPETGNYEVDAADGCSWTANDDIPGNVTISGSGTVNLFANWTFTGSNQYINVMNGSTFAIHSGGSING